MTRVRPSRPDEPELSRRPRSDATRNAERLLVAAKEVFDERGSDAALDEVARRAGVGNATLYRHFPSRSDLLVAAYSDEAAALGERADLLLAGGPAGKALFDWLTEFVAHVATKRALALAAVQDPGRPRTELVDRWHSTMERSAERLLRRAKAEGAVRNDVSAPEVLALANGVALCAGGPQQARRLLRYVREGIAVHHQIT